MVEVVLAPEALSLLKREGVKSLSLTLSSEVFEWTPCCGIGDVCLETPKVEVKRGGGGGIKLKAGEVDVYLDPELTRLEGTITVTLKDGRLTVEGLNLEPSLTLKRFDSRVGLTPP